MFWRSRISKHSDGKGIDTRCVPMIGVRFRRQLEESKDLYFMVHSALVTLVSITSFFII